MPELPTSLPWLKRNIISIRDTNKQTKMPSVSEKTRQSMKGKEEGKIIQDSGHECPQSHRTQEQWAWAKAHIGRTNK